MHVRCVCNTVFGTHTPAMPDPPAEAPHTDRRAPSRTRGSGRRPFSPRWSRVWLRRPRKASTTQGATPRRRPPPPCRYPSPRRASRRRPPLLQPRRAARPPQARQHSSPCRASPGCAARAAASFLRSRGWTTTRRRRRRLRLRLRLRLRHLLRLSGRDGGGARRAAASEAGDTAAPLRATRHRRHFRAGTGAELPG